MSIRQSRTASPTVGSLAPAGVTGRPGPAVTAHAGCLGTRPNTPESFAAALEHPVDFMEADVRFTANRVPYLSHDPAPDPGRAMPLAELLRMAAAHPQVCLNLDLKETSGVGELSAMVRAAGLASRVLLTGVVAADTAAVRAAAGGLPYMLNAAPGFWQRRTAAGARRLARRIRERGAIGLNAHHRFVTRRLAERLEREGLAVSVWTVDGEPEMRRMLGMRVHNVTTRRVDRLIGMIQGRDA
jgi:glycerophosphoryl diester phosphodiesterase